jgi:nitrate/nitrite transport system permease protein
MSATVVALKPEAAEDIPATESKSGSTPPPVAEATPVAGEKRQRIMNILRSITLAVLPPMMGLAFFILIWVGISMVAPALPGPAKTWASAVELFSDPFYINGPNDQGIGWNILNSLQRVGTGFGMAALIGIPLGFVLGRFKFVNDMASPIISADRPVGVQGCRPGCNLGDLHLQYLASGDQYRDGRIQGAAGLPQRRPCA